MAKPSLAALPLLLPLLDYWPLGRMTIKPRPVVAPALDPRPAVAPDGATTGRGLMWLLLEKLPLVALAAAACAVTLWAESNALAPNEQYGLPWRIGNALISYAAYLGQFFYPVDLAVAYPRAGLDLPPAKVLGALLLLAAITAAALLWRRRRPYLLVGWAWYVVMLLPVIGLVQFGARPRPTASPTCPRSGCASPWPGPWPTPAGPGRTAHGVCLLHSGAGRPAWPPCWHCRARGVVAAADVFLAQLGDAVESALACVPQNKVALAGLTSFLEKQGRHSRGARALPDAGGDRPAESRGREQPGAGVGPLRPARRGDHALSPGAGGQAGAGRGRQQLGPRVGRPAAVRRGHRALSRRRSGPSPTSPRPATIWAMPWRPAAGWTRRFCNIGRPCSSSPTSPRPTATWATPWPAKTASTRPSPVIAGPEDQARRRQGPQQPRLRPGRPGPARRGHRRVPPGDQPPARFRRRLLQSRQGVGRPARVSRGDCELSGGPGLEARRRGGPRESPRRLAAGRPAVGRDRGAGSSNRLNRPTRFFRYSSRSSSRKRTILQRFTPAREAALQ